MIDSSISGIGMFFISFLIGLAATLIMIIIEIPVWKKFGLRGVLEWHENQVLATKFFRLSKSNLHIKSIFFLHFVNGGLGGIGFVLLLIIFELDTSNAIIIGIAYGIFLWMATLIPIHKPITGITPWGHPNGNIPLIASLIGHLVYGIVIGLLFVKMSLTQHLT